MAKSIDLFFVLLGSIVCLYTSNQSFYVTRTESRTGNARHHAEQNLTVLENKDSSVVIRKRLQAIYSGEIGVREKTNKNDGERIAEYLKVTGLPEGYAWCAAFVSWTFAETGFDEPRTAWSPALFPVKRVIWTKNANTSFASHKSKPIRGDVFGIYFNSHKRIAHAGFVDEWGDKYVITVEGNTNEENSREGDGVYRKRRPISSIYQVANWVN